MKKVTWYVILLACFLVGFFGVQFFTANAAEATGGGHQSVTFCHKPGTPAQQTLTTDESAWKAHKNHGDKAGPCAPIPSTPPAPVVIDYEDSWCVSSTLYEHKTWTVTDGVITQSASSQRPLDRAEAIALGCYTPPVPPVCEDWQVPGVLNEHGDATSCVGDAPQIPVIEEEVPAEVPPLTVEPEAEPLAKTLPQTGVEPLPLIGLGALALALGGIAWYFGRKRPTE